MQNEVKIKLTLEKKGEQSKIKFIMMKQTSLLNLIGSTSLDGILEKKSGIDSKVGASKLGKEEKKIELIYSPMESICKFSKGLFSLIKNLIFYVKSIL